MAAKCLLLVAVVTILAWEAQAKTKCPWAVGKYPYDDSKMNGDWYVIAGTPLFGEQVNKCGKFSINSLRSGDDVTINTRYSAVSVADSKSFVIESVSQAVKVDKASNTVGVWKREGTSQWSGVYKQTLIATDYENYAVFFACRPLFDEKTKTFGRHLFAEILGRKETLNKDVLDTLTNLLTGYDVEPSKIITFDQSSCK